MEQPRNDPCVSRMAVDGKVEVIMAVHVDGILGRELEYWRAALVVKLPMNNIGELTQYTGSDIKSDWELWKLCRRRSLRA